MPNEHYLDLNYPKMDEIEKAWAFLSYTKESLKEISRKTGFSIRQLSKYRKNLNDFKHIAKYDLVKKLADLFEVDYATQLGGNQLEGDFGVNFAMAHMQLFTASLELQNKYPYELFYSISQKNGLSTDQIDQLHIFEKNDEGNQSVTINAVQEMLHDPFKKTAIIEKVVAKLKNVKLSSQNMAKLNKALEEFKKAPIAKREMMYLHCEQSLKESYKENEAMMAYVYHQLCESLKEKDNVDPQLNNCNIWQVDRKAYDLAIEALKDKSNEIIANLENFAKDKPKLTFGELDKFISDYPTATVLIDEKHRISLKPSYKLSFPSLFKGNKVNPDDLIDCSLYILGAKATVTSDKKHPLNKFIANDSFESSYEGYAKKVGRYCGFNL